VLPNPEWREGALELIVRLVLQLYCSWWFRFVQPCECFPLKLLLMVERPPDYIDPIRQEVSKELLLTPKSELMTSKVDDISWKLVEVFKPQLQRMATTGTCSQDLYTFLLHYRGQLPGETQDLEGLNSKLQWLTNISRNMQRPAADASLCIRSVAGQLSADELAATHSDTKQFMKSQQNILQFAPIATCDGPDIPKFTPLPPLTEAEAEAEAALRPPPSQAVTLALAFNCNVRGQIKIGASNVTFVERVHEGVCAIAAWGYYSQVFMVIGSCVRNGDVWRFHLTWPLKLRRLSEMFADISTVCLAGGDCTEVVAEGAVFRRRPKRLHVHMVPARWQNGTCAILDVANATVITLQAVPPRKPSAADVGAGEGGLGYDWLAEALEHEMDIGVDEGDEGDLDACGEPEAGLELPEAELLTADGVADETLPPAGDEEGHVDDGDVLAIARNVTDELESGPLSSQSAAVRASVEDVVRVVVSNRRRQIAEALALAAECPHIQSSTLSLVVLGERVMWVYWSDASTWKGRRLKRPLALGQIYKIDRYTFWELTH
jgi:hypothetical protein